MEIMEVAPNSVPLSIQLKIRLAIVAAMNRHEAYQKKIIDKIFNR